MGVLLLSVVAIVLLCCLRVGSLADRHDEILRNSENEKY